MTVGVLEAVGTLWQQQVEIGTIHENSNYFVQAQYSTSKETYEQTYL